MAFTGRLGSGDSAFGSLVFGEEGDPLSQSVTSTLAFLSEANANSAAASGESILVFAQDASALTDHGRSVTSTLAFVSEGSFLNIPVESVIAFVSDAVAQNEPRRSVESILVFAQDLNSSIKSESVQSVIAFDHDTDVHGPVSESVQSIILFAQAVVGGADYQKSADNFIVFAQVAGRAIEADAESIIIFVDAAERKNIAISTLALVSSAIGGKGADVVSDLGLTSTANRLLVAPRSVSSPISFLSSATYTLDRTCVEQNYTPFVGTSNPNYTPPTTTPPTLGSATLTLTYPYTSPTSTLVLRNPEFRNQDTLSFNRINRETRGGTLIVFADPNWPKSQVLSMQVDFLKQSQVDDLLQFFLDSLGKEVGLLDHENRQWRGIILTPDAEVTHAGRENRSVQFQFDGALV